MKKKKVSVVRKRNLSLHLLLLAKSVNSGKHGATKKKPKPRLKKLTLKEFENGSSED